MNQVESVVYDADTIARRVRELGAEVTAFYPSGDLLLLGTLKGSFIFMADLVRAISRPLQIDFVVAASYGSGTTSGGVVELRYEPEGDFEGKHVLVVEDIVDSGTTLNRIARLLAARNPLSLEVCTLLHKRLAPEVALEPRFVGFEAPHDFLVGYGLDFAEDYRHLPYIGRLKTENG
jgi:hypoxanthine phosphoribosyltransferase